MKRVKKKQIIILVCVIIAGIAAGGLWGLFSVMWRADSSVSSAQLVSVLIAAENGIETVSENLRKASAAENSSGTASEEGLEEKTFQEQEKAWFMEHGSGKGLTEAELEYFYEKMAADDIWRNESRKLHSVMIGDFDGNGQTDMIAMAGSEEDWETGGISFYFNEEPVFVYEEKGCTYSLGFWWEPCVADVDNDGNTELILEVSNGGCGGPGGRDVVYLRHTGESWEIMEEPWGWYPGGFNNPNIGHNEVCVYVDTTCISEDKYEAYCEYLDEKIVFEAENCWEPEGMRFGEMGGGTSRGLFAFTCTEYEGRNALQCAEYLYGEGGIAHGIGNAMFLFVWDEEGNCNLEKWWIETFSDNEEDTVDVTNLEGTFQEQEKAWFMERGSGPFLPGGISLYFNEEPVFVYDGENCSGYGSYFAWEPCVADIDNDGNTEVILEISNGGCGGAGGRDILYLGYREDTWEVIDRPWDLEPDEWIWHEVEIDVDITCISEDRYEAYCEYLNESIEFEAENYWEPESIEFGRSGGGNSRGLFGFTCTEYKGRNVIVCSECLYGEGGYVHAIGTAKFMFAWDENGNCNLEKWWIEPRVGSDWHLVFW